MAPEADQVSVTLGWSASSDNVAVAGYDVSLNGSRVNSLSQTSYRFTGFATVLASDLPARPEHCGAPVMADQLECLFPENLSVLSIVKRNFAWKLKVETTG